MPVLFATSKTGGRWRQGWWLSRANHWMVFVVTEGYTVKRSAGSDPSGGTVSGTAHVQLREVLATTEAAHMQSSPEVHLRFAVRQHRRL
jgi:hypothetical protein